MLRAGLSIPSPFQILGQIGADDMELIESGTISSPVEYLDIDLPSGYEFFVLLLANFDTEDAISGAFSSDGGSTFIADLDNFDTYISRYGVFKGANNLQNDLLLDAIMSLSDDPASAPCAAYARIDISPGSATAYAYLRCAGAMTTSNGFGTMFDFLVELKPDATVPPTIQRINLLRLSPYGNGDINPPTGGDRFNAGSYFLYGIPTP